MGQRDNTLVIWEIGDNGASMEGGLHGVFNEMTVLNGVTEDPANVLQHLDEIGGPECLQPLPGRLGLGDEHALPVGQAGRVPFRRHAQSGRHLVARRIKDVGGIRTQFHHVIDIAPTILEAAGIRQPTEVNGVVQRPIEGVSMRGQLHECPGQGEAADAILRDARQPGHLSRRLGCGVPPRPAALGALAGRISSTTPGSSTISTQDFSESHDVASTGAGPS